MAEVRGKVHLANEPLAEQPRGHLGIKHLDRHAASGVLLHGEEDARHPARADFPFDVVAGGEALAKRVEHVEHHGQLSAPPPLRQASETTLANRGRRLSITEMGRIWKSPFVRLVAYYVLLRLVTLLIVLVFLQIRDLFNQFQELSPVHGGGGKGKAIEAAASGPGPGSLGATALALRSEEHTSELQSRRDLVCRLLLEKKNNTKKRRRSR